MRPFIAALLLGSAPLAAQGGVQGPPLRPTDMIRALAAGPHADLADRVARDCLTFTPSVRDRRAFLALGADSVLMTRIDACVRRGVRKAAPITVASAPTNPAPAPTSSIPAGGTASPPATTPAAAPATPTPVPPPAPAQPSPEKTGFVQGVGQRGVVGTAAAAPLVFEVRDSAGKPLVRHRVTFTADNAQLRPEAQTTDTGGRVRVGVVFGQKAGKTVVRAAVGQLLRSATLYPTASAPTKLELHVGANAVGDTLALTADTTVVLRVVATDEFGNAVALVGLQPLSGDEGVVRIEKVGGDSLAGTLNVHARGAGTTQLALQASGILANLTVTVTAH
jgi:hypothetical protein